MKSIQFACLLMIALAAGSCSGSKKAGRSGNTADGSVSNPRIEYPMLNQQTFALTAISSDESYGYTPSNPIHVGGTKESSGPLNQRRFLNALLGPAGEEVSYVRKGSCCAFKTENGFNGFGLLDRYEVSYTGLDSPLILYIDMYDYGELKAPKGFTFRK
jgi:hypothetical protein